MAGGQKGRQAPFSPFWGNTAHYPYVFRILEPPRGTEGPC
jgi:hypothetical protein